MSSCVEVPVPCDRWPCVTIPMLENQTKSGTMDSDEELELNALAQFETMVVGFPHLLTRFLDVLEFHGLDILSGVEQVLINEGGNPANSPTMAEVRRLHTKFKNIEAGWLRWSDDDTVDYVSDGGGAVEPDEDEADGGPGGEEHTDAGHRGVAPGGSVGDGASSVATIPAG